MITKSSNAGVPHTARWWFAVLLITFVVLISSFAVRWSHNHGEPGYQSETSATSSSAAQWADETLCQNCHQPQSKDWEGSHHQLAMLLPTENTVRGDFNGATLHSDKEITEFFRKGEDFWVRTPGADGEVLEFAVAYTFGWEPLQQYLIALEDGRLQALGAAWDTEREQWFHLYDGQGVDANHPLHWSRPAHNANTQCVECHTTGFETGYDAVSNQFNSSWQSLGVGCQACHGPAGGHLNWARSPDKSALTNDDLKGFAQPLQRSLQQVETCGRCHSRRTPLGEPAQGGALEDAFLVSSLTADLYEVDGKILDEVFEHGSFLQSRMHQAGVACSDCHNPHSGRLRAEGNAVCSQCHNPAGQPNRVDIFARSLKAFDYNTPAHHHHEQGSPGAQCRNCHMPGKLYMGNDLRHDHSFSSPNPLQARALNHSDACLSCHGDEPVDKVIAAFEHWYPNHHPRDGGYTKALHMARQGQAGAAGSVLAQLARDDLPALRRATLLTELPQYPSASAQQHVLENIAHNEAAVRRAAIDAAAALLDPQQLQQQLSKLLNDPLRSVRLAAVDQLLMLAEQHGQTLSASLLEEYEQVQLELLANAEAHFNLARLYQLTRRDDQVEAKLRTAMELNPAFSPASIALAQWLDGSTPGAGMKLLEERLRLYPKDPDLHHALGLANIRSGRLAEGVQALERAWTLAPDNDHYAYVLAVAWHDTGQRDRALELLRAQLRKHPANRSLRLVLLGYLSSDRPSESEALMEELRQQNPNDPALPPAPSFGSR